MAKIYSNKAKIPKTMKPKREVVSFLLSYSKALSVIKIEDKSFEIIVN